LKKYKGEGRRKREYRKERKNRAEFKFIGSLEMEISEGREFIFLAFRKKFIREEFF